MFIKPPHSQEIVFDNKTRLTLRDVTLIEQGNWSHIECKGKEYIVNNDRILFIKVYKEDKTDYEA